MDRGQHYYSTTDSEDEEEQLRQFFAQQQRLCAQRSSQLRRRLAAMRRNNDSSSEDEGGLVVATPQESTAANSTSGDTAKPTDDGKAEAGTTVPGEASKTDGVEDGGKGDGDKDDDKADGASKEETLDPKLVGMSVGLKLLYSGKEDKKGRFQWQTTIPEDVGKPAEDNETRKWALIVRHVKVYNDPSKVLAVHSIVVQSPLLKDLLKGVLKGYPGVTVGLQRLEFGSKFEPLIHRWSQLTAAIDEVRQKVRAGEDGVTDVKVEDHSAKKEATTSDQSLRTGGDIKSVTVDGDGKPLEPMAAPDKQVADTGSSTETKDLTPDEQNALTLKHAALLHGLLVKEFQTLIDSSQDMKGKGVMTYEYLWTLFQPGAFVFSKVEGQDRVFKLVSGRYGTDRDGNPVFWLTMLYVDYDGVRFGYQKLNVFVRAYNGTRGISTLSSYPLEFHQHREDMKKRLVSRGERVESLAGTHYRSYDGMGWREGSFGRKEKYSVKGRVMVDTYGWNRFVPNASIYVNPLNKEDPFDNPTTFSGDRSDSDEDFEDYDQDMEDGMPIDGHFADEDDGENRVPLNEDQKLMCTHLIRGYALKEKMWLNMYANSVHDISFNTRAFDSLVLPESQKELILGFTSSQQSYRNRFDDVIEGKGRGIILLLSGPPGVGKTLTAESVAEEMRVPLFVMSAGDVGLDTRHIESRLTDVFEMVTRWNAILLLDEADVFLEERSLHEIERNKLVSIFLRVLEYYEGIMFLTTNRVQTFDAAFQSRIHISLDYQELSIESRKQVWHNFLRQHNIVQKNLRDKGPSKATTSDDVKTASVKETEATEASEPAQADTKTVDGADDAKTTSTTNGESMSDTAAPSADDKASPPAEQTDAERAEAEEKHQASTQPHCISSKDIDFLARMQMNGRQIKNVLKTAQLLASRRKEPLSKGHIQTVLEVTQHLHNATRQTERARSAIFC